MEGYIRSRNLPDPPIPWIWGGDGRYMYNLNAQDQTVSVIDTSTDTVISTITLTAGKDFASIFYRSLYHEVHCCGNNWVAIIDGDPDSGTFNTITFSGVASNYSLAYVSGAYLPFPVDNFLIGGSTVDIVGPHPNSNNYIITSDRRYSGGATHGHSLIQNQYLTPSGHLYSFDFVFKLKRRSNGLNPITFFNGSSTQYYLERAPNRSPYHDLLGQNFPVIQFGNFCFAVSGTNVYGLSQESAQSNIYIFKSGFLPSFSRAFQEYCPNAPNRLFWTDQNGQTKIIVGLMDYTNKDMTVEGTIDRAAYKDTNEQGANAMIYNPYSGRMYVQANNNNQQNTGVGLIHIYDPTQALVANMYIKSLAVGQMKSASRVSVTGLNTLCFNRTRLYEYPNIRL